MRPLMLFLALVLLAPSLAGAQEGGLDRADRLAREGRTNEARAALVSWWDSGYEDVGREEQQRALWLRARLTVNPDQAIRDYQRLVVLFPGGGYADRALFRLIQAAHAMGDEVQARTHLQALVRDYPGSPVRREAEAWLRDAGVPPSRPKARAAADQPGGPFSVQLGAFGDESRATAVGKAATDAGFEARTVRVEGSPLLHVRVGSFPEREPAQALFEALARAGLQGAVVRDERMETAAPSEQR